MFAFTASFDKGEHCPADFDGKEYARGIQQERLQAAVTVTAAAFSPCGGFLVCASDSGRLAVWELAPYVERGAFSPGSTMDTGPDLSFQADDSCINRLITAHDLLLCGGDEALFGWPWSEIVSALRESRPPSAGNGTGQAPPPIRVRCPQARKQRGSFMPYAEINDVVVDETDGRILCASGDGNAYEWDLETLLAMSDGRSSAPIQTYKGHKGYLHAVASAPGSNLVATGSDDGYVALWDRRVKGNADGASVVLLQPAHATVGQVAEQTRKDAGGDGADRATWVSSLEMDEGGHTLVCGGVGGREAGAAGTGRGWVNQWNLAAFTTTSVASLPAEVQCMAGADDGQTLLLAGAEPYVTYLSRSRLEARARTPASTSSIYALAVNPNGANRGMTCVAGVGPSVDIYTLPGIVSFTLCFM